MDDYNFDDYDDFDGDGDPIEEAGHITCQRCGETDLTWEMDSIGEGWHLINNNGDKHECHLKKAAEGFERIE